MSPLLELRAADLGHPGTPVLRGVDLALEGGELLVLRGPSGGGKSTLLHAAVGTLAPSAGRVRRASKRVAWVPQHDQLGELFPVAVLELVTSGAVLDFGWSRRPGTATRERVQALLERLGLARLAHRRVADLSGGERQRALVARAFAARPELLALDEPTSSLDEVNAAAVVELAREAAARGCAVVVATHQHELFTAAFADTATSVRVARVAGGQVVEEARPWR